MSQDVPQDVPASVLARLIQVIQDRKARRPPSSYTTQLLDGGVDRMGGKLVEEAAEAVEAARVASDDHGAALVYEAADLVYHLLVLLVASGRTWEDVEQELSRRFGISGLEEKSRRG